MPKIEKEMNPFPESLSYTTMDWTFDQTAPLDWLKGSTGCVYSIDLKSTTARWPLRIMVELTKSLFGAVVCFGSRKFSSGYKCL